jgi:hypothetical protein
MQAKPSLMMTFEVITGYHNSPLANVIASLWILAVIQTLFVKAMRDMYGDGE